MYRNSNYLDFGVQRNRFEDGLITVVAAVISHHISKQDYRFPDVAL
jgi:hypothetical protein